MDDNKGEITFAGYGTNEDRLGRQEGDFPITGGIGEFAGITGDIDFVTDLTGTVVSQSYITCQK